MVEFEASNVTPPLKNSGAMKCVANLGVGTSTQTVNLTTLFGALSNGHYVTLAADGGKVYIAFGGTAGTIDETATGVGATVCWPLPDGAQLPVRLLAGKETGTGVSTLVSYNVLHYKGTSGTYLRVYRSSVAAGQGSEQFPAP